MVIAIDFDDTYTIDPTFWNAFIGHAKINGHTVYCVTWRHRHEGGEVNEALGLLLGFEHMIFTGRQAKRAFCERMAIYVDVVIDDNPSSWDNGYGGIYLGG